MNQIVTEGGTIINHARMPESELKPDETQRGRWRWRETPSAQWWLCYWDGGEFVDCYGPFAKPLDPSS